MGVIDVPQWLSSAFTRSALALGATAPREQIEATCEALLQRWHDPDRRFHNLRHLIDVLARVDELAEETHNPDIVRLAAWYHGAIFNSTALRAYSRSGGEDELASADLAREELGALGLPEPVIGRVTDLIVNLKRHDADPRDIDSLALCDADLAVLAADPQRYRAYRKAVREEYAHIPPRHYLEARIAIVTKLLARRHLFLSPMGAQWEDAARENLRAELDRLQADLAALGECAPGESVREAEAALEASGSADGERRGDGDGDRTDRDPRVHGDQRVPHRHAGTGTVFAPARAVPPSPPAGSPYATSTPQSAARPVRPTSAPSQEEAGGRAVASGGHRSVPDRPSSLESTPDVLSPFPAQRREGARDREEVARDSRERVDLAVREAKERARRERLDRDRLEAARAARPERTELTASWGRRPTLVEQSAASPAEATAPSPADAAEADDTERPESLPHHGIEREPDLIEWSARRRGGKKREKKVR